MTVVAPLVALVIIMISAGARPGSAGQPTPTGPRAIAMGNAYTGLANDVTAIYWNPAWLPWIGNQEITGTHADLFGTGIKDSYVAFALPFSPSLALAADCRYEGFNDGELSFGDTRFDLACGFKARNGLSLGLNAKYLTRNTKLDDVSVRQGSGAGIDLGLLATPFDRIRIGADLHDLFDTRISYDGGNGTTVLYERGLRVGAAIQALRNGIVCLDIDDRLHVGAEYSPIEPVALRGGLEKDLEDTGEAPAWDMGVGLRAGILRFDYALSLHPTLGETSHFGVSLGFNFNPARVRIEKVEARDVFASLQKTYAGEPFGTVRLKNLQDRPLTAQLSVFSPELMDQGTDREIVLRPGATQDVPLTATFSDRIMETTGDRRVHLSVGVSYLSQRLPRTERRSTDLIAYGPGAVQWGGGVAQAAAFVTQRDPAVIAFAREACRPIAIAETNPFRNRNIGFAAAIVDALGALGMAYVPDPNSPFRESSQSSGTLDTVHYPRETLEQRAGDCDDTSVLLAALLESVGVPTSFVDVPGHLFLLAGTGVHGRNALALGIEEGLYVVEGNQVWIPIETTAMSRGFAAAWKEGAEVYAQWASRGSLSRVPVEEAQARYEPATLPETSPVTAAVTAADQAGALTRDAAALDAWRSDYLSTRYGAIRSGLEAAPPALDEIAHVYFLAGEASRSREILEQAIAREPASARFRNNIANTYAAQGDAPRASEYYRTALAADSSDAGVWLNLGLVRYFDGDTLGAGAAVAAGLVRSGGYARACRLLGLPEADPTLREGKARLSAAEARDLLKKALGSVPIRPTGLDSATTAPRAIPPVRPPKIRLAAARAGREEPPAISELLYWKE